MKVSFKRKEKYIILDQELYCYFGMSMYVRAYVFLSHPNTKREVITTRN